MKLVIQQFSLLTCNTEYLKFRLGFDVYDILIAYRIQVQSIDKS